MFIFFKKNIIREAVDVCLVNLPGGVGEGRRGKKHDETADETIKTNR